MAGLALALLFDSTVIISGFSEDALRHFVAAGVMLVWTVNFSGITIGIEVSFVKGTRKLNGLGEAAPGENAEIEPISTRPNDGSMDPLELRVFLHALNNAINASKINVYLLKHLHGSNLDQATVEGLEKSILDAERLTKEFQVRVRTFTERLIVPQGKPANHG